KVNLKVFYENHKDKYVDFVESEIEQILVDDRLLAIDIAKKIYNGEKFESYKGKYNTDGKSIPSPLVVSSINNPLGEKAAQLSTGDIFAPVQTDMGYHVIRVVNQKKHYLPYDKIKTRLANSAQADYYVQLHSKLLPAGYDAPKIEYNEENLDMAFTDKSNTIF
ncbi:MAG: peptidyl-prolyl cis-trans isomerase, partial [Gammaproteobacteria bacterium]|nr:peptidyl-prolyl cis-trans isomerase [Gammaproteobacteria bacterium]